MSNGVIAWLGVFLTASAGLVVGLILGKSAIVRDGVAVITWTGWLRLLLLRAVAPLFVGVSRSLGIGKLPVQKMSLTVETGHGAVKVTIYRPQGAEREALPVHFNFHGGGFVVGFPQQDDVICRHIAVHAHCAVINVDYALAPEQPFPTAIFQSYLVIQQLLGMADALKIDPHRLTLGGFSAGGGIVAALAQLSKECQDFTPRLQVLLYPGLDFSWSDASPLAGAASSSALTPGMMAFFRDLYLPRHADRAVPLASPVLAEDLAGLPPALVITAGRDLVKEGGRRYAERLAMAGVAVTYREFQDCDHGFTHSGPKQSALDALELMIDGMRVAATCPGRGEGSSALDMLRPCA